MQRIWHWWWSHHGSAVQGQTLILFALLLPVLAGFLGLTVDAGNLYYQRRHLQSIADAAALAGAQQTNFNAYGPAILVPEGLNDAQANGLANVATASKIQVFVPPVTAPYSTYENAESYIEVVVTRTVNNAFMDVLGQPTSRVRARAVARAFMANYGNPAILALDEGNLNAVRFNGGGPGITINGDIVSYGGINTNGIASHFQVDGSAYAYIGEVPNVTASGGAYTTADSLLLFEVVDPLAQGMTAGALAWPAWPTSQGYCEVTRETPSGPTTTRERNNVTVQSSERATCHPGTFSNVRINGGDVTFARGVYVLNDLYLGAGATATDHGAGVLFRINGTGEAASAQGGAQFSFSAYKPYAEAAPPPAPAACSPYPCNTWADMVFYLPNGSLDFRGNGSRQLTGGIYAPNGEVAIEGNGLGSVVNGQIIANTVLFSGVGPLVDYAAAWGNVAFGPILVNTPEP